MPLVGQRPRDLVKPSLWDIKPTRTDPDWAWFWDRPPVAMYPGWSDAGSIEREILGLGPDLTFNAGPIRTVAPSLGQSILYDDASSQYLEATVTAGTTPFTAAPNSIIGYVTPDADVEHAIGGIFDASANSYFYLQLNATAKVEYRVRSPTVSVNVTGVRNEGVGTPVLIAGVSVTNADHNVYENAVLINQQETTSTPIAANLDTIAVGRATRTTPEAYFSGHIHYVLYFDYAVLPAFQQILVEDPFGWLRMARPSVGFVTAPPAGGFFSRRYYDQYLGVG